MIPRLTARGLLACAALLFANSSFANQPEPLWELGLGGFLTAFPDYRGSDNTSFFGLPGPYGIYRGKRFTLSRDGARASLIESIRAELSLSLATSLPGEDDDNPLRSGMPELGAAFELGPSLDFVFSNPGKRWLHRLRMPLRAVMTTTFDDFKTAGWLFHPNFESSAEWGNRQRSVGLTLSAGPLYATNRYHDHFYTVEPQFARAGRPAFDAAGGYSGARANMILALQYNDYRLGFFLLYDNLSGADFTASPLVETDDALIVGLGFSYRIWESKRPAYEDPLENPNLPPAQQPQAASGSGVAN